eukprot:UN28414
MAIKDIGFSNGWQCRAEAPAASRLTDITGRCYENDEYYASYNYIPFLILTNEGNVEIIILPIVLLAKL